MNTKTVLITGSATPKETAETIYSRARKTKLFLETVVTTLQHLAGVGERCLYCGSSEASQVDHFKPKANFPEAAMTWENFIWICGVCNQNKGNQYPSDSALNPLLINPIDEDIWQSFSLDRFGFMLPRWDIGLNDLNVKAKVTEATIKLNRQAVQEARNLRIRQLETCVHDCILLSGYGHLSAIEKDQRMRAWIDFPFHPEVPQYFLQKEGMCEEPFATFLNLP